MNLETGIAFKYAYSRTKGQRSSSIWITLGIAVGLMALIIISSVISGLQNEQLRKIRNVESFDVIIGSENVDENIIMSLESVSSVYEFIDDTVLLENEDSGEIITARIRGIDYGLFSDSRFSSDVFTKTSEEEFSGSVCLSPYMRSLVSARTDSLFVTFIRKGKVSNVAPYRKEFSDPSFYSCTDKDFSSDTVLADINTVRDIIPYKNSYYGIYLNSERITETVKELKNLYPDSEIITYKDYSRSLYSALMLERALVYLFLSLIFLIICTNLKTSTYRLVLYKADEIKILRAIGMTERDSNRIFVIQGLVVSVIGTVIGTVLGVAAVENINLILSLIDRIIFLFTGFNSVLGYARFECVVSIRDIAVFDMLIIILSVLFTISGIEKSKRRTLSVSG